MKFWMHGLFAGSLAGALWAGLWQLVLTMVLIVTTGAPLSLQLGPAVLTGISVGVIAMTMRRDSPLRRHQIGAVLTGLLLFGFSLGSPFDPQGLVTVWQSGLFLVMNAIVIWFSISATVGNTPATRLTRYLAEIFYLRLLWGRG